MQKAFINIISMFKQEYAQFPIFSGLDGNQIRQLSSFLVEREFQKDTVIFDQGQVANYLYILLTGEVSIRFKPYDGPPLTVARILPGGVFGWSAALQRDLYTSGAVALDNCLAFCLCGSDLQVICRQHPETGKIWLEGLASVIAERLRSTYTQVLEILNQVNYAQDVFPKKEREHKW